MTALLDVVVVGRAQEAEGIVSLDLAAPDGRPLPPVTAGAHIDVHVAPGLVRPYSLCGNPADTTRYRLGILREPQSRGGSAGVHESFTVGSRVRIGPPRNNFPLAADAAHTVLIGGGIGITPLLAMARHLHDTGQPFVLHYCARQRQRAAFLTELDQAAYRSQIHLHFDDGPEGQRLDPARDLPPPGDGTHLYVCGPTGFADWVTASAKSRGYAAAQLHREDFAADVDVQGVAFEVVLARSNRTIAVPTDRTIVDALADIGIKIDTSCEQGICGTCLCTVLDGIPDHRDSYLTGRREGRQRPDTRLLLAREVGAARAGSLTGKDMPMTTVSLEQLAATVQALSAEVQTLRAEADIRRVQARYMFLCDTPCPEPDIRDDAETGRTHRRPLYRGRGVGGRRRVLRQSVRPDGRQGCDPQALHGVLGGENATRPCC